MLLLDTQALVWQLEGNPKLSAAARGYGRLKRSQGDLRDQPI